MRSPFLTASSVETGVKPSLDGLLVVRRAGQLRNNHGAAAVAKVLGMAVTL